MDENHTDLAPCDFCQFSKRERNRRGFNGIRNLGFKKVQEVGKRSFYLFLSVAGIGFFFLLAFLKKFSFETFLVSSAGLMIMTPDHDIREGKNL